MIIQITVLGFITIISIYYVNYIIPIITKFISLTTYNIFFTNIIILVQLDNLILFNDLNKIKNEKIENDNIYIHNKKNNFNIINLYTKVKNKLEKSSSNFF